MPTKRSRPHKTDDQKLDQIKARCAWLAIYAVLAIDIVYVTHGHDTLHNILITLILPLPLAVIAYIFRPGDKQMLLHLFREWRLALLLASLVIIGVVSIPAYNSWFHAHDPVIPDKVIKLGVDLPLSGDDAADGKAVRNGIELAVKQSDAIAGYRVQIDAKSDANKITQLPDEDVGSTNIKDFLKDPRVVGIIGPYNSGVALKEIPIVNGHNDKAQRIALVSPSATADCLTTSQYATSYCNDVNHNGAFFRIAALNAKSGETFANCLAAPAAEGRLCPSSSFHKFKTVAIIDDSTPYSVGFAQSFRQYWERNSGTKTALREVSNKAGRGSLENALQGTIADLGDTPDVVFFAGSEENTKLLHQIMQQGRQHDLPDLSRTPFASGASIMDDDFVTYLRAQRHTADVYAAAPIKNIDTPNTSEQKNSQEFITRYREAYGAKPTPYAAAGYDAANIIIQAIQAAAGKMDMPTPGNSQSLQDFRDKVIFGIKNPVDDSVAGVTGRYAFNEQGDFKDAAVSVFRWDPSNSNNQNGWDYQ